MREKIHNGLDKFACATSTNAAEQASVLLFLVSIQDMLEFGVELTGPIPQTLTGGLRSSSYRLVIVDGLHVYHGRPDLQHCNWYSGFSCPYRYRCDSIASSLQLADFFYLPSKDRH